MLTCNCQRPRISFVDRLLGRLHLTDSLPDCHAGGPGPRPRSLRLREPACCSLHSFLRGSLALATSSCFPVACHCNTEGQLCPLEVSLQLNCHGGQTRGLAIPEKGATSRLWIAAQRILALPALAMTLGCRKMCRKVHTYWIECHATPPRQDTGWQAHNQEKQPPLKHCTGHQIPSPADGAIRAKQQTCLEPKWLRSQLAQVGHETLKSSFLLRAIDKI